MDAAELLEAYARGRRDFTGAYLVGQDLRGACLPGVTLAGADLMGAALDGADLRRTNLAAAVMVGASLTRATLTGGSLVGTDLRGADLVRANLTNVDARRAGFDRANLCAAVLHKGNFTDANLRRADLREADVTEAVLCGADLSRANLTRASLVGADLAGTLFASANLTDADVTDARFEGENNVDAVPERVAVSPSTVMSDRLAASRAAAEFDPRDVRGAASEGPADVLAGLHDAIGANDEGAAMFARHVVSRTVRWVGSWTIFAAAAGAVYAANGNFGPDAAWAGLEGACAGAGLGMTLGATSAVLLAGRLARR
jgi:uncharacterized protein YjbI with pentapeptide repeats